MRITEKLRRPLSGRKINEIEGFVQKDVLTKTKQLKAVYDLQVHWELFNLQWEDSPRFRQNLNLFRQNLEVLPQAIREKIRFSAPHPIGASGVSKLIAPWTCRPPVSLLQAKCLEDEDFLQGLRGNYEIKNPVGDGNCLFHAFIEGTQAAYTAEWLRGQVYDLIKNDPAFFVSFPQVLQDSIEDFAGLPQDEVAGALLQIPAGLHSLYTDWRTKRGEADWETRLSAECGKQEYFATYVREMENSKLPTTHFELEALAKKMGVKIIVHTKGGEIPIGDPSWNAIRLAKPPHEVHYYLLTSKMAS